MVQNCTPCQAHWISRGWKSWTCLALRRYLRLNNLLRKYPLQMRRWVYKWFQRIFHGITWPQYSFSGLLWIWFLISSYNHCAVPTSILALTHAFMETLFSTNFIPEAKFSKWFCNQCRFMTKSGPSATAIMGMLFQLSSHTKPIATFPETVPLDRAYLLWLSIRF